MVPDDPLSTPHASSSRYLLCAEIASGGMATVYLGKLLGGAGFSRTVAIKRMHPHLAKDPDFVAMFIDEARVVARIQHPNVIPLLDVVALDGELSLVIDYVHGETLGTLLDTAEARSTPVPLNVATAIAVGMLEGLHAAHEAADDDGAQLEVVHRDVSPQNVMIGQDGVTRVLDFGVAKALGRSRATRPGEVRGRIPYMAPEQIGGDTVDRRADVYAVGVVLWEIIAGRCLVDADNEEAMITQVLENEFPRLSAVRSDVPSDLDDIVTRALDADTAVRYQSARDMAVALEAVMPVATLRTVRHWVEELAREDLERKAARVAEAERTAAQLSPMPQPSTEGRFLYAPGTAPASSGDGSERRSAAGRHEAQESVMPDSRRKVLPVVAVSLAVALVVAIGVWWLGTRGKSSDSDAGDAGSTHEPSPVIHEDPAAQPEGGVAAPAASTSIAARSSTAPRVGGKPEAAPRARPPRVPPRQCNPPFTIDHEGYRVPKPECL